MNKWFKLVFKFFKLFVLHTPYIIVFTVENAKETRTNCLISTIIKPKNVIVYYIFCIKTKNLILLQNFNRGSMNIENI